MLKVSGFAPLAPVSESSTSTTGPRPSRACPQPAKAIVYVAYNNPQAAEFLSSRTGIPALMLPFTVGGSERAKDLFGLFDDTLTRLLQVAK